MGLDVTDKNRTHRPFNTQEAARKSVTDSKVRPFLLYSLRHSFATRIAPHVDAWTLCKIMGWSSLSVAMTYIHPSADRVLAAFEPLRIGSGDKIGDSGHNASEHRSGEGN